MVVLSSPSESVGLLGAQLSSPSFYIDHTANVSALIPVTSLSSAASLYVFHDFTTSAMLWWLMY